MGRVAFEALASLDESLGVTVERTLTISNHLPQKKLSGPADANDQEHRPVRLLGAATASENVKAIRSPNRQPTLAYRSCRQIRSPSRRTLFSAAQSLPA